jgi:indolepyruvate ferredoxin oxidoreductase, beta subunit
MAKANGSVISATMFGALAAAGVLPFPREAFEAAVRAGGTGVEASLRAFGAAFDRALAKPTEPVQRIPEKTFVAWPKSNGNADLDQIKARIDLAPEPARRMLAAGARKLVDYLDPAYASEYLDHIDRLADLDRAAGGEARGFAFTAAAAKYLANAMAYDDVARVADLKIRASRRARVRAEVGAGRDTLVATTEYFHPRVEEICGALPKAWGEAIEARPRLIKLLRRIVDRGRRIRPDTISGYLLLSAVASLGPRRRRSLRHSREAHHIDAWLKTAAAALAANYALGVETLACRRLVKGYSDTHARGLSKFDRVIASTPALSKREDGAIWLDRLKRAALADEQGAALDGVLKTIATL